MRAQVLFGANNIYTVVDEQGEQHLCRLKGKRLGEEGRSQDPLAPGDWVELQLYAAGKGLIEQRLPRRNVLRRQGKRVEEQVMAANIDQVLVMASLTDPAPQAELINRFLLLGQAAGVPTRLLFNKVDLLPPEQADFICHRWQREFQQARVEVLMVSVTSVSDPQWHSLVEGLQQQTTAVIGTSGVGKSSLINRLLGYKRQLTAAVSLRGGRGTHTTTRATMITGASWRLIDTPGIRSLIPLLALADLHGYFPEFWPHLGQCHFSSCCHMREPGCAVRQGVRFGAIPLPRYQCYQRVYSALKEAESYD